MRDHRFITLLFAAALGAGLVRACDLKSPGQIWTRPPG
jgi:hypothetical protein